MKTIDENFDGRISYAELRDHFVNLGFDIWELEGDNKTKLSSPDKHGNRHVIKSHKMTEHRWRDKALELIIKTCKNKIPKVNS